jgi:hypothetical protein
MEIFMQKMNKIVKEYINFERGGSTPLKSMNIGRRSMIENWLKEMDIDGYNINEDLSIDAQNVSLTGKDLKIFPEFIKFRNIERCFYCDNNGLISLRGCPEIVKEYFTCGQNLLTSLEGGPKECLIFSCTGNKLTSLEGCPKNVRGRFYCGSNTKKFTINDVLKYCNIDKEKISLIS